MWLFLLFMECLKYNISTHARTNLSHLILLLSFNWTNPTSSWHYSIPNTVIYRQQTTKVHNPEIITLLSSSSYLVEQQCFETQLHPTQIATISLLFSDDGTDSQSFPENRWQSRLVRVHKSRHHTIECLTAPEISSRSGTEIRQCVCVCAQSGTFYASFCTNKHTCHPLTTKTTDDDRFIVY